MAIYRQWWNEARTAQITTLESIAGVVPGTTVGPKIVWLYNDKGGLNPDTTTLAAHYLVAEASFDGGVNWVRSGPDILNNGWIEVAITGIDTTGSGGMPAQSTTYVQLGAGRSQLLSDIPKNCGRQITYRVIVPLGASNAGLRWRLNVLPFSSALIAGDVAYAAGGGIAATNVQAAIAELDTEKAPKVSPTFTGFPELNQEDGAFTFDSAGLKRFGIAKSSGLGPEIRYLNTTDLKVRLVTAGTIAAATASTILMDFGTTGRITFRDDTYRSGAESGFCGMRVLSTGAAAIYEYTVQFRHRRAAVPTVSLSGGITANCTSAVVGSLSVWGFRFAITTTAAGDAYAVEKAYTTSA
jgi:hypothetical protein